MLSEIIVDIADIDALILLLIYVLMLDFLKKSSPLI